MRVTLWIYSKIIQIIASVTLLEITHFDNIWSLNFYPHQECSTEGIADILTEAKNFIQILASRKSFNLIVRLLCGIGRYREMFYAFDVLFKNEAFESLLGQFSDKQTNGLKSAIITYLNENHPNNHEFFQMVAAHFSMWVIFYEN